MLYYAPRFFLCFQIINLLKCNSRLKLPFDLRFNSVSKTRLLLVTKQLTMIHKTLILLTCVLFFAACGGGGGGGGGGSTTSSSGPSVTSSSFTAAENQTSIGTIVASAGSAGGTLTYSLSGTDASAISLSSVGLLAFNSAPDFETKK